MRKILIVDDDEGLRQTLKTVFKLKGYQVLEASNGGTAVQLARKHDPAIIVSDIDLPGMDGIQELQTLRQDPKTAHIPIILITGQAQAQEREGMELGADDFIIKPFPMAAIVRSVEARLHEHHAVEKVAEKKLSDLRRQIGTMLPREFSAPLSEILVYSDVLKSCAEEMEPEQIREIADTIDLRARYLERVMKSFLLFAELERAAGNPGEVSRMRDKVTENIVPAVTHAAREKATAAGRTGDLAIELHEGRAEASSEMLESLVGELVDNAFKFSNPGQPVKICSRDVGNFLELSIIDQGCGMAADSAAVTDAYVQLDVDSEISRGLGLGLTIAKRIAELHGGMIEIKSKPGDGTTVRVKLPARLKELRDRLAER